MTIVLPLYKGLINIFRYIGPDTQRSQSYPLVRFAVIFSVWFMVPLAGADQNLIVLERQAVTEALTEFAEMTGLQLVYPSELTEGLTTSGAKGKTPERILEQLLEGTDLTYEYLNPNTVTLIKKNNNAGVISVDNEYLENQKRPLDKKDKQRPASFFSRMVAVVATGLFGGGISTVTHAAENVSNSVIEEVIVSATRRDTALMDTPLSIAVVNGDSIEAKGIVDIQTLYQTVPGLAYRTNGGNYNAVSIRGLAAPGEGGATVGIYLDDVSVTDSNTGQGISQISGAIFDLKSIEVLKGPQGTLYGESTLGGAIRYISNAPDPSKFDFGVKAETENMQHSDDLSYIVNAMVNAPITDKLALRVTGSYRERAGLIDVPAPRLEDDVDWREATSYRAKLAWYPTDRLTLGFSAQMSETDRGGPGVNDFLGGYSNAGLSQPDFPNGGSEKIDVYSFSLDYGFDSMDVEFRSSRFERESLYGEETTPRFGGAIVGLTNSLIGLFDPTLAGLNPIAATGGLGLFHREAERDIHELRIVSNDESNWQWAVGLYYKEDQAINDSDDPAEPGFWLALAPGFQSARPTVQQFIDPILAGFFTKATIDSEEKAIFGEVSYEFNDAWELMVGARFTKVKRDTDIFTEEVTDDFVSPKVSLTWRPRDQLMTYLTVSQGFRPGVINSDLPGVIAQLEAQVATDPSAQARANFFKSKLTVDGDEVVSYELGLKTTLWDGRARLSAALYHLDWKDTLVFQPLSELTGLGAATIGQSFNDNLDAGAESQGAEFELSLDITERWGLDIGYDNNWTAETKGDAAGSLIGADGEPVLARKGSRLPSSPRYSWSIATDYEFALGSWTGNARLDLYRVTDMFNAITNEVKTKGYDQVDARLSLFSPSEKWRISVFGVNLTDELITYECNEGGCMYGRPLTVGASVSYGL